MAWTDAEIICGLKEISLRETADLAGGRAARFREKLSKKHIKNPASRTKCAA